MSKFVILFAGLLTLAACNANGNFNGATNETPVESVAEPTDGLATDNN